MFKEKTFISALNSRLSQILLLKWNWIPAISSVILIYTTCILIFLHGRNSVENLDFWFYLDVGRNQALSRPASLVHGFYALGYPFLLKEMLAFCKYFDVDIIRLGQTFSWFWGVIFLISIFWITRALTDDKLLAWLSAVLVGTNPQFLTYAARTGPDVLALGLQSFGVAVIFLSTRQKTSFWPSFAGGVLLGFAYLFRYQSLVLLPPLLLFILMQQNWRKNGLWHIGFFTTGFILSTAVQTIPSLIVHYTPFYTTHAKNVWFGIYSDMNWVDDWGKVPSTISLIEVIQLNPLAFLSNWIKEFLTFFYHPMLWTNGLHILSLSGLVFLLFYRSKPVAHRLFMVLLLLGPVTATAMAWIFPRFLLFVLGVQGIIIGTLAATIAYRAPLERAWLVKTVVLGLIALFALFGQGPDLVKWLQTPVRSQPERVHRILQSAGLTNPAQAVTNNYYYHAVDAPDRERYTQLYRFVPYPTTLNEFAAYAASQKWRFIALDWQGRPEDFVTGGDYTAIKASLLSDKDHLVPLNLTKDVWILCILPCTDNLMPLDISFENGMKLNGYYVYETGFAVGVYTSWLNGKKSNDSVEISIKLLDDDNQILAQVKSEPQQGTFPIETWKPGQKMLDFAYLAIKSPRNIEKSIQIVLYDKQKQEIITIKNLDADEIALPYPVAIGQTALSGETNLDD